MRVEYSGRTFYKKNVKDIVNHHMILDLGLFGVMDPIELMTLQLRADDAIALRVYHMIRD